MNEAGCGERDGQICSEGGLSVWIFLRSDFPRMRAFSLREGFSGRRFFAGGYWPTSRKNC